MKGVDFIKYKYLRVFGLILIISILLLPLFATFETDVTVTMADNNKVFNNNANLFRTKISYNSSTDETMSVELSECDKEYSELNENNIDAIEIIEIVETNAEPIIDFDIDYMAKCVMAEAGGQDEIGVRLVIDIIFNRADMYGISVTDVINAPNQFAVVANGSIYNVEPYNEIYVWIKEEYNNRYNYEVLYFRMYYFHNFGTPLFQHGDHFFSTI